MSGPHDDLLVSFDAGKIIVREGDPGDEMFIVESGEVELVKHFGGNERRLATLGVGDFFGEMSVLEEIPRTATVRALSACRLLPIDPSTFDHLLRKHPEVTVRMMRRLTRRLRQIDEETEHAHAVAAGVFAGAERGEALEPIDPKARLPEAFTTASFTEEEITKVGPTPDLPAVGHLVHVASGTSYLVDAEKKNVIGRFDPKSGEFPEINLTAIDDRRSLSRRHARVRQSGGQFFVREEVGVANGTYLGRRRLSAGEEHEIRDGDKLKLGLVELVLRVSSGDCAIPPGFPQGDP